MTKQLADVQYWPRLKFRGQYSRRCNDFESVSMARSITPSRKQSWSDTRQRRYGGGSLEREADRDRWCNDIEATRLERAAGEPPRFRTRRAGSAGVHQYRSRRGSWRRSVGRTDRTASSHDVGRRVRIGDSLRRHSSLIWLCRVISGQLVVEAAPAERRSDDRLQVGLFVRWRMASRCASSRTEGSLGAPIEKTSR